MKWVFFAAALSLAGCGGGQSADPGDKKLRQADPDSQTDPEPAGKVSGETPDPPPETPVADPEPARDDACIKACIDRNMARAVAAEQIRKDCEAECADTQSPKE